MKRIISSILMLSMMTAVFAGCGEKEEEGGAAEGSYKVGYAINSLNDTGQTFGLNGAQEKADELGVELVVSDATEDVIKQQDNVAAFVEQGVDAIVVVPVDTSAMGPITDMVVEAGIPLVYMNRNPFADINKDIPEGVYYIGSQEFDAGMFQARYIGELLEGEGKIAVLQGMLSNEAALKRTEGVVETLKDEYPNIEIVAMETANWQRDQAMSVTENLITKFGDELDAVLANNDEMALGAANALQQAGFTDVKVLGVDATPDAVAAVKDGTMAGTVLQNLHDQGGQTIEIAVAHLEGTPKEQVNWIPFELRTLENIDD